MSAIFTDTAMILRFLTYVASIVRATQLPNCVMTLETSTTQALYFAHI
jgi:hypothetical protein